MLSGDVLRQYGRRSGHGVLSGLVRRAMTTSPQLNVLPPHIPIDGDEVFVSCGGWHYAMSEEV